MYTINVSLRTNKIRILIIIEYTIIYHKNRLFLEIIIKKAVIKKKKVVVLPSFLGAMLNRSILK